jgi:hypothetical protein
MPPSAVEETLHPANGECRFLWNDGIHLPYWMTSHPEHCNIDIFKIRRRNASSVFPRVETCRLLRKNCGILGRSATSLVKWFSSFRNIYDPLFVDLEPLKMAGTRSTDSLEDYVVCQELKSGPATWKAYRQQPQPTVNDTVLTSSWISRYMTDACPTNGPAQHVQKRIETGFHHRTLE